MVPSLLFPVRIYNVVSVTKGNNSVPAAISKLVGAIVSRTKKKGFSCTYGEGGREGCIDGDSFRFKPACSIPSGLKMISDNWKQPDTWWDKSRDIVPVVALKSCKGKLEDTAA